MSEAAMGQAESTTMDSTTSDTAGSSTLPTTTTTSKPRGKGKGRKTAAKKETTKDPPPAPDGTPSVAVAAMAVAAAGEDDGKPPDDSVEAAAAEAGLAVVSTSDNALLAAVPPLGPPGGKADTEESPFAYPIHAGKDVVSGKGGKVQQFNRHFRNLVAQNYPAYDATTSKIAKRRIGVSIFNKISEDGGRFLDEKGAEMDRNKAILKVMKALKDAKTWTSDAKRAAKERREAKLKNGGTTDKNVKSPEASAAALVNSSDLTSAVATAEALAVEAAILTPLEEQPAAVKQEEEKANVKTEETPDEKEEKDPTESSKDKEEEPAKDTKPSKGKKKVADSKKAAKTEEEDEEATGTRETRRSSKRRQLPLTGTPPAAKAAKKGSGEGVDSAVRGLHLLSQATHAVVGTKKKAAKA